MVLNPSRIRIFRPRRSYTVTRISRAFPDGFEVEITAGQQFHLSPLYLTLSNS
jgi:hypothetical protein